MTSDKDVVLDKIRLHFLSKYRHQPNITLLIEQELKDLAIKATLSKSVQNPSPLSSFSTLFE